jgi:ubiquinone/menaquinone biosynthesis C-methylase UbiE
VWVQVGDCKNAHLRSKTPKFHSLLLLPQQKWPQVSTPYLRTFTIDSQCGTVSEDIWTRFYESLAKTGSSPADPAHEAMVAKANELHPFAQTAGVIDAGTGSGDLLKILLATHAKDIPASAPIVALDKLEITPQLIDGARAQNPETWKRVQTVVADINDLSRYADGSFGHILYSFSIMMLPDPVAAVRETLRVLTPGGVFAANYFTESAWMQLVGDAYVAVYPEKDGSWLQGPERLRDPTQARAILETAGLKDIEMVKLPTAWNFSGGPEQVAEQMTQNMPYVGIFKAQMTEEQFEQWTRELGKLARDRFPDGKLPGEAVVWVGRK